MISGALLLSKNKIINIKTLYLKNILKLGIILVFWGILYQLYHLDFVMSYENIKLAIYKVLNSDTQAHFWFLYVIIGIYICIPFIKVFILNATKKQIEYVIYVFFIFVVIKNTLSCFQWKLGLFAVNNINRCGLDIAGGYLGYFILGYYLNEFDIKKRMRQIINGLSIVSIIICIGLTVYNSRIALEPIEMYMNYLTLFVFLWSTNIFLVAKYHYRGNGKMFREIAKVSLGIYAIHMFVIFEFWKYGLTTFSFVSLFSVPCLSILVFIFSFLFVELIKKIPILGEWLV